MDFQHREGGKTGTGGLLSASESNANRRERLRKLAMETIDLSRDPYFLKNHLGSYECRLCLTLHVNEGSYLVHTQGKKHQSNLGRRRAREAQTTSATGAFAGSGGPFTPSSTPSVPQVAPVSVFSGVKIGRPGYKIVKIRDPITKYLGLRVQVHYPTPFAPSLPRPLTRLMSAFEQRQEAPNKLFQYLLIAAPMYETVALKVPAKEINESWSYWDEDTRLFTHELTFK
jgi:splicing factor 3A subunit 2